MAWGLFFTVLLLLFSGIQFVSIRAIGDNFHASIKNYYLGMAGTIVTLVANLYFEPAFFEFNKIGTG